MKSFSELREARDNTVVFTFGRFNPPTTGHEKLITKLSDVAKQNSATYMVFPSHSQNAKKDPLPHAKKIAYMRAMFPKHKKNIIASNNKNVFAIATELFDKGFKNVVMVVGSDRVDEFKSLLTKYNNVEGRHGFYNFDSINVVSAGERDPDAEGVTGMSASKMRAAASANNFDQFKLGLPSGFKSGEKLFKDIRKYMGIRESFNPIQEEITSEDVFRDMYVKGEVLNIGDTVTDNYTGVTGAVIRRGTNYVTFAEEDGTTHRRWLYELQLDEELVEDCWPGFKQVGMKTKNGKQVPNCVPVDEKQDKDIKDKKGTQPAKYFAKDAEGDEMAKSTKDKRDAHFNKGKEKDDDDPSAYKPAPGDASAKTKPSSYTNKMKKKFPDLYKESQMIDEDADKSLAKKAEASGISVSILKQVYKRGVAAWRTGHRPGTTPEQWGHARVNSFITGGKTRTTADADLWKKHKGKSEGYVVEEVACPVATQKVDVNTKNRNSTIKNHMYGPLNVDEPADYWDKIADKWDTSVEAAKKSLCGNCVAFDISPRMEECMPGPISDDDGRLGYCWMHHFKCHSARTCDTWAKGGPIKDDKVSHEWQTRAFREDSREIGTDARREMAQSMTPGQKVKSFSEHIHCGTPNCCNQCETSSLIESNVYRVGSEKYYEFFQEKRKLYESGDLKPVGFDKELLEGDIGKFAEYEGKPVPLDCPMMESEYQGKDVELNKPKAGGPKKYYVYVKDPSTGNIKKVTWGDTTGLKVKLDDPQARKSFAARHDCENQKDKTKAGYWACNLPRYAKQLGLSGGGNFFW